MKTKHGLFFSFAVLALTAMFALAGCGDNGDPSSPPGSGATYTVIFDPGDGNGPAPSSQTVSSGTSINLPGRGSMTAPSGKTFNGWRADGTNYDAGDSYTVTGYVTFIAQWSSGGNETIPNAPTGVTATAQSSSSISVSWNSASGATSYDVYYAIDSSSTKNLVDNVSGTSYTHTGLQASTTYYYYIKAKNNAGESDYSSLSGSASATTSSSGGSETIPNAPTDVTATAQSSSSISVSWSSASGATSYDVYFEVGSSSTKNFATNVSGTSYTHTGLQASTTYYYYIKAKNSAGESDYSSPSDSASATTSSSGGNEGGETSIPSAPTNVQATAQSSTRIQISWNVVPGATSYKIYSPETAGSSSNFVLLGTATTNSYTDNEVLPSQTWYYKVSAVNSAGESTQSASVSARTPNRLSSPTNVVAASRDDASRLNTSRTSIKITWDAVSGAVSYKIYEWVTYLGGYWDWVGSTAGTEWTHTGLQPGTTHSYRIMAVDSGGSEGAAPTTIGGKSTGSTAN